MGRKWGGGSTPFVGEKTGSPSNTKSPELRPTPIPSGLLMHRTVWPMAKIEMGTKIGRGAPPLLGGGTEAYLHAKYHLHSFNHLATINMGRKFGGGGSAPFWGGECGPHLTQSRLGRGLAPYQCKAVTGLATFSARLVIYLMLIRRAGT